MLTPKNSDVQATLKAISDAYGMLKRRRPAFMNEWAAYKRFEIKLEVAKLKRNHRV